MQFSGRVVPSILAYSDSLVRRANRKLAGAR
jgi:hypothetical protein